MPLDLASTLSDLVALPSVNPMGRPAEGDYFFEHRVTAYLEQLFDRLGVPWQRQRVEPLRENIVARFDGDPGPDQGGKILLFEAHQDTVPVDGMTIDPWKPVIRAGRMYGRGACDIKGGMAAMLGAFSRVIEERPAGRPTIIMACTVNEEHGYSGALALGKLWEQPDAIIPRRPDACVVAEPTELHVVVAHKGTVRWRLHTNGRATHSSQPHLGDNAIYKMARVIGALEAYAREFAPAIPAHRLCGQATLSVGLIRGGISVNTVPDRCTIEIDRRVLPGEKGPEVYQQILDFLAARPELDFPLEHEPAYMMGASLADTHNGSLAEQLVAAAQRVHPDSRIVGVPYGTDASKIAETGVPSVVFGPGSIDQAHTADEWLDLEQLRTASEVLYQFASRPLR